MAFSGSSLPCGKNIVPDNLFLDLSLTVTSVPTPWIEALRRRQAEDSDPGNASKKQEAPSDRKLEPKRMSDSYHSVVLPLGQDPWLLDTYLNASGHIRLGALFMDLDALSGIIA
jgi:acyl-coenzyme A thioesterase 9